jgi:trk system potassium uptake protein TrkH
VHIKSVVHLLGLVSMFLAAAMLLPIPVSLYYGGSDYLAFLGSAVITLVLGFLLYKTTNVEESLRAKEGFAVVTFGWLILSFFGCLPFMLSGAIPSFTDAFYETISGFTTTGATILTDIESLPEGILFWRSLTHWIGGMGIIVLSLAILPFLGIGGMQLFKAEVPGPTADKLTPRITETAKILWGVYVLLTAIQTGLLMFGGMSLYEALCHAFGTMATGGYSTLNGSIGGYNSAYIEWVTIIFMFLAGANFAWHYRFLLGEFKIHLRHQEFLVYSTIIGIATIFITLDVYFNVSGDAMESLRDSLFQVISIVTTTGYGTADYEAWSTSSQFILFVLMFIGGCAGSTAGGMKVIRIHLLVKFMFSEITRLIHPHAIVSVRLGEAVIPREVITNILGYFVIFMSVFGLGVFAMTLVGMDIESAFGASIANLANIGPGLNMVGPTDNYAHVPALGKWILSAMMLMGRLDVFTVIILFSPSYWRK